MDRNLSRLALAGFIAVFAVLAIAACKKNETQTAAQPTRISATRSYERYFGTAPTADKGTCYAFVIYFPSAKEPGKVIPFPFFTFDEGTIRKIAVERLIGGMEEGSYQGEFLQLFAPGTRLLGMAEENGILSVNFSKEILAGQTDAIGEQALIDALTLTLSQFNGIKGVRIIVEGRERGVVAGKEIADFLGHGSLRRQPFTADESRVAEPGPPRLLGVTAVKDKGAKSVDDVSAYFDRPVEIQKFSMTDSGGRILSSETYQSVFDMAAVLKPRDPNIFRERMPIRVLWQVTDRKGRHGEGNNVWLLQVKEH